MLCFVYPWLCCLTTVFSFFVADPVAEIYKERSLSRLMAVSFLIKSRLALVGEGRIFIRTLISLASQFTLCFRFEVPVPGARRNGPLVLGSGASLEEHALLDAAFFGILAVVPRGPGHGQVPGALVRGVSIQVIFELAKHWLRAPRSNGSSIVGPRVAKSLWDGTNSSDSEHQGRIPAVCKSCSRNRTT
uniref:Putative secreted protein n=1 Tax=Ixodes ricinus TaxID=34613 RepID=A0A6B0V0V7_IXORI